MTHGPSFGNLDLTPHNMRVGCELLETRLMEIKPFIHTFGHIHHSYGIIERNDIYHINSSICNERYEPKNKPIIIDLIEKNGQFLKFVVD
jgi:Icc-related predicted phosphoesterase